MEKEFDAVVIGAGVAGSSMAYSLAGKGWKTALIDKDTFPRHKACGEFLSPESLETLNAFGISADIFALRPAMIKTVRLHSERGTSLEIPLPGQALGLSRYALDASLQLSAIRRGVSFSSGKAVTRVTETPNGYEIEIASEGVREKIHSRTVIAAWGRRPLNGLEARGKKPDESAYVGIKSHLTGSDGEPVVDLYFFEGGYIGISPIEGDRMNAAALISRSAAHPSVKPVSVQEILDRAAERIPALKRRLSQSKVIPGTYAATFPVRIRPRPMAWNGMAFIGDAAAVIPPFCGDGMAMALRSAELCVPLADAYLRGDYSKMEWRRDYTRQIKRHFSGALRWGSLLERAMTRPAISHWLLRLGQAAPGVAERMVRSTRLRG